jgi:hypothetical protein
MKIVGITRFHEKASAGRPDSFKRGSVYLGEKQYFQPHIDVIPTQIVMTGFPLRLPEVPSLAMWV